MLTDWWKVHLGPEWQQVHERHLDTIGNLTLTGYNPQLSNADFPAKQKILLGSHLELNRHFADASEWDAEAMEARAENLSERALQVWSYIGPQQASSESSEGELNPEDGGAGLDIAGILSALGGGTACNLDSRLQAFQLDNGDKVVIKYSKLHNDKRNLYWYGLKPGVMQGMRDSSVTHVVFVMGQWGLASVPIELVENYCKVANISNQADGSIKHYHVVISHETTPKMVPSQGHPRYPLKDHFRPFEQNVG